MSDDIDDDIPGSPVEVTLREHAARLDAIESGHTALSAQIQKHMRLLTSHEESLAKLVRRQQGEQERQSQILSKKLDIIIDALVPK